MALELQISTTEAQSDLDALTERLGRLEDAIENVKSGPLDDLSTKISNIKPDDAIAGIEKLNDIIGKLSSADGLGGIIDSLNRLASVDVASISTGVEALAAALSKITVPEGLAGLADQLTRIKEATQGVGEGFNAFGQAAANASQHFNGLGQAAASAAENVSRVRGGAEAAAEGMGGMAQQVIHAAESFGGFHTAAGIATEGLRVFAANAVGLPSILAAATVGLGLLFRALKEGANEVGQEVENLQRKLNAFSKNAEDAPAALEKLNKIAFETGFSVQKLEIAFGKYMITAEQFGMTAEKASKNFETVAIAAKAIGATEEKVTTMLNSWDRGMANGTLTARLFGNSLQQVGFATAAVDKALVGMSYNTKISVGEIQKVIDKLGEMFPLAKLSLTMAEYNQRLANSFRDLQASFAVGDLLAEGNAMNVLSKTVNEFQHELNAISKVLGVIYGAFRALFEYLGAGAMAAIGVVIRAFESLGTILNNLTGGILPMLWEGFKSAAAAAYDLAVSIGSGLVEAVTTVEHILVRLSEIIGYQVVEAFKTMWQAAQIAWAGLQEFGSWIAGAFRAIWEALPDWFTGAFEKAFGWITKWWGDLKQLFSDGVTEIKQEWHDLMELLGIHMPDPTVDVRKGLDATATAADNAAKAIAQLGTAANPFLEATPDKPIGDKLMQEYYQKYGGKAAGSSGGKSASGGPAMSMYGEPVGPSGVGLGQYVMPGGTYTAQDLIKGTGFYDTRPDALRNPFTASPSSDYMKGGQVGPQASGSTGDAFTKAGDEFAQKLQDGLEQALNTNFMQPLQTLSQQFDKVTNATLDEVNALNEEVFQGSDLLSGLDMFNQSMNESIDGNAMLADTIANAANSYDKGNADLISTMGELSTLVQDNSQATMSDVSATRMDASAEMANTGALNANTASNYAAASSPSSGGGGGGGEDNSGAPQGSNSIEAITASDITGGGNTGDVPYMSSGGVVGRWGGTRGPTMPMSAWNHAKHFAGGGVTSGIPIVAHADEAVIPLQGGAVPVSLSGNISQVMKDTQQTIINVGVLAHNDATAILKAIQQVDAECAQFLISFNAASARSTSSISGLSSSITQLAKGMYSGDGMGGGAGGGGGEGGGQGQVIRRGWWGTSNLGGTYADNQTNMYQSANGGFVDANGHYIPMAGAADGLENTNMLAGMGSNGVPITVHPDEAIVNLDGGGRIPVSFPRGNSPFGNGMGAGGGGTTIVNHFHIPVRDVQTLGKGPSRDQILQDLRAEMERSFRNVGTTSLRDDPTVRTGTVVDPRGLPRGGSFSK